MRRFLKVVRDADAQIWADILERSFGPPDVVGTYVEWLRSPERALRDAAVTHLCTMAQSQGPPLEGVPLRVTLTKWQILADTYLGIYPKAYTSRIGFRRRPIPKYASAAVLAALSCFRDFGRYHRYLRWSPDNESRIRDAFAARADEAESILAGSGTETLRIISSVASGVDPWAATTPVEEGFCKEQPLNFMERIAAVYALAELTEAHPEAQEALTSLLRSAAANRGGEDDANMESEFRSSLIEAMGCVTRVDHELLGALLEMKRDHHVDSALATMRNPSPEAVRVLVQDYEMADPSSRSLILRVLGSVESLDPDSLDLIKCALEDEDSHVRSAAAVAIGNQANPDLGILEALIVSLRHTPQAAPPLAKVVSNLAPVTDQDTQGPVRRALKALSKALRRTEQRWMLGDGPSVAQSWYAALGTVLSKLALLDAEKHKGEDPLLPLPAKGKRGLGWYLLGGLLVSLAEALGVTISIAASREANEFVRQNPVLMIGLAIAGILIYVLMAWVDWNKERLRA